MRAPTRPLPLYALATLVSIAACDLFGPPEAEVLTLAASEDQEATVGNAVAATPAVRAENQDGPLAGVLVRFVVTAGGGSVTGAFALTDRSGSAEVGTWRLGPTAGLNTLEARVEGVPPVVFNAIATPDRPASMDAHTGKGQTGVVAAPVPVAPSVLLRDRYNNPVADMEVRFEVTGGGGTVTEEVATSDADGVAGVDGWTLGTTAGTQSLVVRFEELIELTFEAVAEPGPPAVVGVVAGDGQTAVVASELPVRPAVVVTDEFSNPIEAVPVTFDPGPGGGSITDAVQTTDGAGRATAGSWTLGTVAGPQTLAVAAGDLEPLTITAQAQPGAPAAASATAGAAQTATVGTEPPVLPTVRVEDEFGNGVPDIRVRFTEIVDASGLTAAANLVVGGSRRTNPNGVATVGGWTLGTVVGTYELAAAIRGIDDPVIFTATGTAGPPSVMEILEGNEQTTAPNTAVEIPPAVVIRDVHGNGVPGVPVTFVVTEGGGTVTGGLATTDADGVAAVDSWTLGPESGAQALTTSSPGLDDVVFSALAGFFDQTEFPQP